MKDKIIVTHEESECSDEGHYLDVAYKVVGDSVQYSTYIKPMATFAYTPYANEHPKAIFAAIVAACANRLLLTNSNQTDFSKYCSLFRSKFIARGYPSELIDEEFKKESWSSKKKTKQTTDNTELTEEMSLTATHDSKFRRNRVLPFKLRYFSKVRPVKIRASFNTHLGGFLHDDAKFVLCNLANRNMFRIRFARLCRALQSG